MKKILLLSDTHGLIDEKIINYANSADEIWHAGDIGDINVINNLQKYGLVRGVYGNIDNSLIKSLFSENTYFECEDTSVLITHIGGYPGKYSLRVKNLIKKYKPKIFISGHSHILKIIYDKRFSLLHFNPGAAGKIGFHKKRTMIKFEIDGINIKNIFVIELGNRSTINVNDL